MPLPWWFPWVAIAAAVLRPRKAKAAEPEPEKPQPEPEPEQGKQWTYDPPPAPHEGASPLWMLPNSARKWRRTSFGSPRPWGSSSPTGKHKAIDIRANENDPVVVPTDGVIVGDTGWVGEGTRGVLFQSYGGPMLVFGAVAPGSYPAKGTELKRGELVARIGRYPKGDSMLHFEVYKVGVRKRVRWPYDQPQPPQLVDPHAYLLATVTT